MGTTTSNDAFLALATLVLTLTACGSGGPLHIENEALGTDIPWVHADPAVIRARTETAIKIALVKWGTATHEHDIFNDGWELYFVPGVIETDESTGLSTLGQTRFGDKQILLDVMVGVVCLEQTPLAHEMGHVALGGDSHHTDPRWHDKNFWHEMALEMAGAVPDDDAHCKDRLSNDDMQGTHGT